MKPTRRRDSMSPPFIGLPNSSAVPSVGGSRPVSIFIVVVLPQPLEPRNPKISPRSMRKLTWSTAVKSPNFWVRPCASIAGGPPGGYVGRDHRLLVAAPRLLGQQLDEGFLERRRTGALA